MKRIHLSLFHLFAVLCLATAVAGCATPPGAQGRGFNDYAGDVISTADNVVTATRTLLAAKKISPDDAENVLKAVDTAREGVKVARGVAVKDGAAAGQSRLRLAADALDGFAAYVNVKPGGK